MNFETFLLTRKSSVFISLPVLILVLLCHVVSETGATEVSLTQISGGLEHPWALDFLPGTEAVVTEQAGLLKRIDLKTGNQAEIKGVPKVYHYGQGGLLDVMVHPEFERNQIIFLTYSAPDKSSGGGTTTLMKARLDDNSLMQKKILFQADPALPGGHHFGSRIRMAGNGLLYFSVGERGRKDEAQDPGNHLGTVIRLNEDGKIPNDNPFHAYESSRKEIFTFGHRNPQGMALHPQTGVVWLHEHGPQGGDEINILVAGANYGWPKTTYGEQYGGGKIGIGPTAPGIHPPVLHWTPSIAPSGMEFYAGKVFPEWNGDLLVGSLKFKMLVRVDIEGTKIKGQEVVFQDQIGRIRDVRVDSKGKIYILNDEFRGGVFRMDRR